MALDTNLIAYWKLDESSGNASDATGNGKTLTNTGSSTFTSGKINNGTSLSGSGQYFTRSSEAYFQITGALTISFWCKSSKTGAQSVVSKGNNSFSGSYEYMVFWQNGKFSFQTYGGGSPYTVTTDTSLSINTWYHVVVTRSGSGSGDTVKIYVNGSSVSLTNVFGTDPSKVGTSSFPLNIGNYNNDTTSLFEGMIDEVGIWTRELTSGEVTQLYNSGNGLSYPFGNAYTLAIAQGSYTLTGIATALKRALKIAIAQGSYTLTGITTAFKLGKGLSAEFGSYVLTGNDTMFSKVISLVAEFGSYTLTGVSVIIQKGISIVVTTGSYVLTVFNARFPRYWTNIAKSVTNWINNTKNSSTWNNQDKSDI